MKETVVEILIDKSGSMGFMKRQDGTGDYRIDGVTRIHLAKKILLDSILPSLTDVDKIFVRTFRTHSEIINGKQLNRPEISTVFSGKFDSIQLSKRIINIALPESGGTPITAALRVAESNLSNFPGIDKKIILLSDGEENGDGNFISTAEKILKDLDNCKIFVIGFALERDVQDRIFPIATGGLYNINAKEFSSLEVRKKIDLLFENFHSDTLEKLHDEHERIKALISTDVAATTLTIDEDYSSEICRESERFAYRELIRIYPNHSVKWINEIEEKYLQYDFIVINLEGEIEMYFECKGTVQSKPTFYITKKEWIFFLKNRHKYRIIRISNLDNQPKSQIFNLYNSIFEGKLMPILTKPEILKEERVFLTIT